MCFSDKQDKNKTKVQVENSVNCNELLNGTIVHYVDELCPCPIITIRKVSVISGVCQIKNTMLRVLHFSVTCVTQSEMGLLN